MGTLAGGYVAQRLVERGPVAFDDQPPEQVPHRAGGGKIPLWNEPYHFLEFSSALL